MSSSSSSSSSNTQFTLERESAFPLPSKPTTLSVYKHNKSDLRCIFLPLPGPLVSLNILLPTPCNSDKGLPHTLEHLIFCGSKQFKHRGYLDFLATRNLSAGTNAYTAEDHTSYQITTAGSEAMINVLPVFMDHVLYPTMQESVFTTEIYHLDGEAKHQGVVYCEMKSREMSEYDLLDINIRKLLYSNSTTYSMESGGLTRDIKTLKNQECIDFHKQFYHNDNITIILTGQIDPDKVFKSLDDFIGKPLEKQKEPSLLPPPMIVSPDLPNVPSKLITKTVYFPSSDEETGTIGFGWRCPPNDDFETHVALEVMFKYLHDTPASPLYQAFVEIESPIASDVDSEVKSFTDPSMVLFFSGIPYKKQHGGENEDGEESSGDEMTDTDDDMEQEDDDDNMDVDSDKPDGYYFEDDRMHKQVFSVLNDLYENALENPDTIERIHSNITRYKRKVYSGLEEDPHEYIASILPVDIVSYHVGSPSSGKHTKSSGGEPNYGTWGKIFSTLDELMTKPLSYWRTLLKKWFIDCVCVQVKMLPSRVLSDELSAKEQEEINERAKVFGEHGLSKLKEKVDKAVKDNEINLPQSQLDAMPAIPDSSKSPQLLTEMSMEYINAKTELDGNIPMPFPHVQIVHTETAFAHVKFFFNISELPAHLKPYLVLFQELQFQSDILDEDGKRIDYKQVVDQTNDLLISHEAAVGLGNDVFHTSWLSEMFTMGGMSEMETWEKTIEHLIKILSKSVYSKERIVSICKNQLSDLVETKRSGGSMLRAVSTRLTCDFASTDKSVQSNDIDISIFKQEKFLNDVLNLIKTGKEVKVVNGLKEIQTYFMSQVPNLTGFVQVALPMTSKETVSTSDILTCIKQHWSSQYKSWKSLNNVVIGSSTGKVVTEHRSPLPFPRVPFSPEHICKDFGNGVMVTVSGLQSSSLTQFVACDVLDSKTNPMDQPAATVMCELLSRMEGPIFSGIRGKGLSYGCGLNILLWCGQLQLSISRSSEPRKALMVFYDILEYIGTEQGFDDLCSQFNLETGQSIAAYSYCASKSTAEGNIYNMLRNSLSGLSIEQEIKRQKLLAKVTKQDLKRVYNEYFVKFFDKKERMTVVVTIPGEYATLLESSFGEHPKQSELPYGGINEDRYKEIMLEKYTVDMKTVTLDDLVVKTGS